MAGKRSDFNQKGWNTFFDRRGHPVYGHIQIITRQELSTFFIRRAGIK